LPRAAVRLPARDIGWPYLARFSAVSGTGPLVTIEVVTLAPVAVSVVVAEVEVVAPTSAEGVAVLGLAEVSVVVEVEVSAGGVAVVEVVVSVGGVVAPVLDVAPVVGWATAAPHSRAEAAAAVSRYLIFIAWTPVAIRTSKAPPRLEPRLLGW
jgi:hypothetical protein